MKDDLDFATAAIEQEKAKKRKALQQNKLTKFLNKKQEKHELYQLVAWANYSYPDGTLELESSGVDPDDNYEFYKAFESYTDEEYEKWSVSLDDEIERISKKFEKLIKRKKFSRIPCTAQDAATDEKNQEKVDKWERDLFRAMDEIGNSWGSEHHGYGSYLIWYVIPFNYPKGIKPKNANI